MTQLLLFILIGAFLAWVMKGYRRYEEQGYDRETFRRFTLTREHLAQSELGLFVALCAKLAKADGRVHELEAELLGNLFTDLSRLFPDPELARTLFKELFAAEKEQPHNADELALRLYRLVGRDGKKCRHLLAFLFHLAFIDGHLSRAEEALIRRIASLLHISPAEVDALMQQFAGMFASATTQSSLSEAYALLGVSADDSIETVKKAYRKRVREFHPDIVKAQGASEAYLKEATEKVQQINAAYETIKRARENGA